MKGRWSAMVFRDGDYAYIIMNGHIVRKVMIIYQVGGFYTIRVPSGGWIRVHPSRLYATEEEAKQHARVLPSAQEEPPKRKGYLPYDVWA